MICGFVATSGHVISVIKDRQLSRVLSCETSRAGHGLCGSSSGCHRDISTSNRPLTMGEPAMTQVVSDFYADVCRKCNFKTRVNDENLSPAIQALVQQLSEETMKRYYGSGFIFPENLEGARVLDLGCGSGSLVYLLSKLVGVKGYVVGVDICEDLIELCRQESEFHYKLWGYSQANFEFIHSNIERLTELGLEEGSFDSIVSNGVFCLCPDQRKVFEQAFKMLKPGGQFILSDVYAEMEQPESLKTDAKLWSLGTTGSLLWSNLEPLVTSVGFTSPYLIQAAGVDIRSEEVKKVLSNADYACCAWRMFKLPAGETRGPATVTYKGNILDRPDSFPWDIRTTFKTGEATNVDGDLASILSSAGFVNNFEMKDFGGSVVTDKNQNPFDRLRDLASQGKSPEAAYVVE